MPITNVKALLFGQSKADAAKAKRDARADAYEATTLKDVAENVANMGAKVADVVIEAGAAAVKVAQDGAEAMKKTVKSAGKFTDYGDYKDHEAVPFAKREARRPG